METENKSHKKLLAILFAGVLMGALDISIVGPAIPSIEKTIKVEPQLLGWIFSIYVLFNLVGIPLFAKLSDVLGRRIIYIIAISIFALGSLVVAFSDNFTVLLIGRSIQGFGASGIFPVASAVVGDVFPPEKRGRMLGLIGAVFGIAFIIGPVLAGTLLMFFKWNVLFLINIPIAIVIIIGSLKILPNIKIESKSQFDWKGVLLLGLILGLFAYGINQTSPHTFYESILSVKVFPFIIASFVLLLIFIAVEKKAQIPVVKVNMFLKKQIRLVVLIAIGTGIVQASFVFIPDFAVKAFNITSSKASFMLIPVVLGTAIGSPLFGRMIDTIGSRLVIIVGFVLMCIGFYFLHYMEDKTFLFYFCGSLIGLGLSIPSGSSLRYIMLNEVSSIDRASSQGLVTIFISIGQMIGGAFIGVVIASDSGIEGYKYLFVLLAIIMLIVAFFAIRLKNRKQELETANSVSIE